MILQYLDFERPIVDLENRLEKLKGDRAGQWSIRINDQWRIVFRWGDDGPEEDDNCRHHNGQCQRRLEKDQRTALPHDESLAHGLFRHITQDQCQHHGRERIVKFLEQIPQDTENHHVIHVNRPVVHCVGANGAYVDDDWHDDGEPDLQNGREDGSKGENEKKAEKITHPAARDEPPDKIGVLFEEHRPGLEPEDEQPELVLRREQAGQLPPGRLAFLPPAEVPVRSCP